MNLTPVKADMGEAESPVRIGAQAFLKHNTNTTPKRLTHKAGTPVRQSIVAAVGTFFLSIGNPYSHPPAAAYSSFLSLSTRAQDETITIQYPINTGSKRGDEISNEGGRLFDVFSTPASPPIGAI